MMQHRQIRTTSKILLCLSCLLCILIIIGITGARAENAASDRLLIYNQEAINAAGGTGDGQQNCRNLLLRGNNTMGGSGCGIYAMAHAYQWLTRDRRNISNAAELLQMFINNDIAAGSNAPWEGSLDAKYGSILVTNYGIRRTSHPGSEAAWRALVDQGGTAVVNVPNWGYASGHYFCVVGVLPSNQTGTGETWLHIVDSSCGSTFKRLYNAGAAAYGFVDHGVISSSTGNGFYRGDEYYISLSTFQKAGMSVVGAYLPGINNNTYRVYFDANGGSCVSEFQYIEYGKKYGPMPAATREGFTWLGWFTSPAVGENINENSIHSVQSDITIYSHWGTSVSFNANGGIDAPGTQWKVYGTYLDITDQQPQRAGYQFINWNTKADGSGESVRAGGRWWGDENTVLYAQWKQDRHMKSPDFTLPASLKTIEEGAFEGLGMTVVRCPEGLEEIGADAFRDCSGLVEIYIPGSVVFIDGGAFDGCAEGLTIFGRAGSVAQACAELNGLEFVAVEE